MGLINTNSLSFDDPFLLHKKDLQGVVSNIIYCIKRIHRVPYEIYKAKLKTELTLSQNEIQFF